MSKIRGCIICIPGLPVLCGSGGLWTMRIEEKVAVNIDGLAFKLKSGFHCSTFIKCLFYFDIHNNLVKISHKW